MNTGDFKENQTKFGSGEGVSGWGSPFHLGSVPSFYLLSSDSSICNALKETVTSASKDKLTGLKRYSGAAFASQVFKYLSQLNSEDNMPKNRARP